MGSPDISASSIPSRFRNSISQSVVSPRGNASPHTPIGRSISYFYGSSALYGSEEESLIFEFGARFLRAGVGGESTYRTKVNFGPDTQRRAGDFSQWLPDYTPSKCYLNEPANFQEWGCDHELWKVDLRNANLGLIYDKLERAVRSVEHTHLIIDLQPKKLITVLSPCLPRALIALILSVMFNVFSANSVTILSHPVMCCLSGGLRSGIVVDIGWAETRVTAVYEFREVYSISSNRACQCISFEMARLLNDALHRKGYNCAAYNPLHDLPDIPSKPDNTVSKENSPDQKPNYSSVSFNEVEDIVTRLAWCPRKPKLDVNPSNINFNLKKLISIPISSVKPATTIDIEFSELAKPAERGLFLSNYPPYDDGDQDAVPVHLLIYQLLRKQNYDVRKTLLSRVIVTGGGSDIPGVKGRLYDELLAIIMQNGWDPVKTFGSAKPWKRQFDYRSLTAPNNTTHQENNSEPTTTSDTSFDHDKFGKTDQDYQAELVCEELDKVGNRFTKQNPKSCERVLRLVETCGGWSGASLAFLLRVRGLAHIDREQFINCGFGRKSTTNTTTTSTTSHPATNTSITATTSTTNTTTDDIDLAASCGSSVNLMLNKSNSIVDIAGSTKFNVSLINMAMNALHITAIGGNGTANSTRRKTSGISSTGNSERLMWNSSETFNNGLGNWG